jgi:hypothetical protein
MSGKPETAIPCGFLDSAIANANVAFWTGPIASPKHLNKKVLQSLEGIKINVTFEVKQQLEDLLRA